MDIKFPLPFIKNCKECSTAVGPELEKLLFVLVNLDDQRNQMMKLFEQIMMFKQTSLFLHWGNLFYYRFRCVPYINHEWSRFRAVSPFWDVTENIVWLQICYFFLQIDWLFFISWTVSELEAITVWSVIQTDNWWQVKQKEFTEPIEPRGLWINVILFK